MSVRLLAAAEVGSQMKSDCGARTTYRQSCLTSGRRLERTRDEVCLLTPDFLSMQDSHADHVPVCGGKRLRSEYPERSVAAATNGEGWAAAHDAAVAAGKETYEDPATGYSVFTSLAHQSRGKCCGSGCRHCCFDHANVRDKARKISRPAWLLAPAPDVASAAVLFWSGGKDSFLALRKLLADESEPEIILLTTFDASERRVAHQDVDIASIVRQAEHLGLPLLGVPLDRASGEAYADSIRSGLDAIRRHVAIERLCFGDLHLEHIRGWREEALSSLGADLHFPLWHADYEELSADLRASGVPCDVSATTVDAVAVGERFGDFETPHGLDAFGERGEFHTLARVWEVPRRAALGV